MQKVGFDEALDRIVANDARYAREAYVFLRDALDFTVKLRKKSREEASRHVTAPELLEGLRRYALKEFGPMVVTVFGYWGVRKCDDIGEMVFNLIHSGVFGKTDQDSIEDFRAGFNFKEAFITPFRPVIEPEAEVLPVAEQPVIKDK
jgi:uncharacterized repeat protein (TIGR04138 family)